MTAQFPEKVTFQGEQVAMYTEPLREYFNLTGVKPSFRVTCSGLWRGYIGRWEIVDGQLFLIGLEGTLEDGSKASLSTVFPNASDRVLAYWYSGTLRIPKGRKLEKFVHRSYASVFEYDLLFEVLRGDVVATRLQHNKLTDVIDVDDIPF